PGALGENAQEDPDVAQMTNGRQPRRAVSLDGLQQQVDERAALEVLALKPLVEDGEDRQQAFAWVGGVLLDLGLEPLLGPELLASLQKGQDQVILGGEVPVEGHL